MKLFGGEPTVSYMPNLNFGVYCLPKSFFFFFLIYTVKPTYEGKCLNLLFMKKSLKAVIMKSKNVIL